MRISALTLVILAAGSNVWAAEDTTDTVQVPVLVAPVQTGDRIEDRDIVMKEVPAGTVFAGTVKDREVLLAMQAKRPLPADKPVNRLHVEPATDIARNSVVTLLYKRPGLELSGSGQALENGRIGDSIRVMNNGSRATLTGVVVDAGTVEIR